LDDVEAAFAGNLQVREILDFLRTSGDRSVCMPQLDRDLTRG
jgi:hypothetical protein